MNPTFFLLMLLSKFSLPLCPRDLTSFCSCDFHLGIGSDPAASFPASGMSFGSVYPFHGSSTAKAFVSPRWNGDSDGMPARSHPLYSMSAAADGLFHCPFANTEEACKHKPEKLKCNYE